MEEIAKRVVEDRALELVDVELKRRRSGVLVQVFVDRQGGVGLDDLQAVSRELSVVLDAEEPVEGAYTLEVSSPGADRPIVTDDDHRRNVGRRVIAQLREPVDGATQRVGVLLGFDAGVVRLEADPAKNDPWELPRNLIETMRQDVGF